ncbi:MAG: hypothetical protein ACR2LK_01110 [Solirubrobacteraceae bacterium]
MTATTRWATCDSPLGTLTLSAGERGLNGLSFPDSLPVGGDPRLAEGERVRELDRGERPAILAEAIEQLEEYFAGARSAFELCRMSRALFDANVFLSRSAPSNASRRPFTRPRLRARSCEPDQGPASPAFSGSAAQPWRPSHDQCGMFRLRGTSSADRW